MTGAATYVVPPITLGNGLAALREALRTMMSVPTQRARLTAVSATATSAKAEVLAPPAGGGDAAPEEPAGEPQGDHATVMAIVGRAQAGDPDAFGELYDRYVDLVFRYVYYRVGGKPLAEDLTSETFLRALRRIGSFTWQGRDFGAWLVTIARNLVADHYKSSRYKLEVTTADLLDAGADGVTEGPEGQVLDSLTNAQLIEAIRGLSAEQQECVVLRFLQGLSVSETAAAMGKNDGAIKALQYRAVRALARLLPADLMA
jgi:RNA polymerase sigma-70 factor (ECF subfamily)